MKLAIVVRRLSTHGGTERFVRGFVDVARDQGHELRVWALEAGDEPDGVEVNVARFQGRGRMGHMLAMARHAGSIPREEVELVLGFVRVAGLDLYRAGGGSHAAWLDGRIHGPADALELHYDRLACREARVVVANSHMAAAELTKHNEVEPERLRVIHNGVDLARFRPRGLLEQKNEGTQRTVLFLGHGYGRKGLATALEAVARIPWVDLWVAGRERRLHRYVRHAQDLGIRQRVSFIGSIEEPEVQLRQVDALVLPTRYDPFANVCLEALACGTPVITTARNGASEILPRRWLKVDDPDDVDGIVVALERALREPGLRVHCRQAAEALPDTLAYERLLALCQELLP